MTTTWLDEVFDVAKPVIAMLHLSALPGDPGFDTAGGIAAVVEAWYSPSGLSDQIKYGTDQR